MAKVCSRQYLIEKSNTQLVDVCIWQLFWSQRHEIFLQQRVRIRQLFLKISEDVPKNSKALNFQDPFGID